MSLIGTLIYICGKMLRIDVNLDKHKYRASHVQQYSIFDNKNQIILNSTNQNKKLCQETLLFMTTYLTSYVKIQKIP
jgi:uncharacterized membrane protein